MKGDVATCQNDKARSISLVICLGLAVVWATLLVSQHVFAAKPDKPGGSGKEDPIYYSVQMSGDLTIVGALQYVDGVCHIVDRRPSMNRRTRVPLYVNGPAAVLLFPTLPWSNNEFEGVLPAHVRDGRR